MTALLGAAASVTLMACYGMTYECDRTGPDGTCVGVCSEDYECTSGYFCDQSTATCEWGGNCYGPDQCPTGFDCDLMRSTCVPWQPCDSHDDCADIAQQRCDFATGECVPTTYCGGSIACGEGQLCDPSYGLCVPCDGAACGSCLGEVTCGLIMPECPEATRPGITGGCYTGGCIAEETCVAEECLLLDQAACTASATCDPSYVGINCTNPDGSPCTGGTGCTCESYEYDRCVPAAVNPP